MNKKLLFALPAVVLVIVVLALVLRNRQNNGFALTPEELLQTIREGKHMITTQEVQSLSKDALRLIDVRSPADFAKGHLDGAINIPTQHLLDAEYRQMFHDADLVVVLYGNSPRDANGPWMMLKQTGAKQIRVLSEGVQSTPEMAALETARYDYAKIFEEAVAREKASTAAPAPAPTATPAPKKSVKPVKKVVVEEEEEGC